MKLSIKKEVTREEVTDIELSPPLFWKDPNSFNLRYCAFLDNATVVKVFVSNNLTTIAHGKPETLQDVLQEAQRDYFPCDESEFLRVYSEALEAIRLHPKEITVNNCMDHEAHNNLKQQISY
jgi:hypothetical protein